MVFIVLFEHAALRYFKQKWNVSFFITHAYHVWSLTPIGSIGTLRPAQPIERLSVLASVAGYQKYYKYIFTHIYIFLSFHFSNSFTNLESLWCLSLFFNNVTMVRLKNLTNSTTFNPFFNDISGKNNPSLVFV